MTFGCAPWHARRGAGRRGCRPPPRPGGIPAAHRRRRPPHRDGRGRREEHALPGRRAAGRGFPGAVARGVLRLLRAAAHARAAGRGRHTRRGPAGAEAARRRRRRSGASRSPAWQEAAAGNAAPGARRTCSGSACRGSCCCAAFPDRTCGCSAAPRCASSAVAAPAAWPGVLRALGSGEMRDILREQGVGHRDLRVLPPPLPLRFHRHRGAVHRGPGGRRYAAPALIFSLSGESIERRSLSFAVRSSGF